MTAKKSFPIVSFTNIFISFTQEISHKQYDIRYLSFSYSMSLNYDDLNEEETDKRESKKT